MRRALQLFILWCLAAQACATSHTLVLVVRADSKVADLDSLTVRKLFLGLPVLVDGSLLHPVRNRSDKDLDPIFLQQIVAMSQSAYDRQILNGVNRQGWLRPAEVNAKSRVVETLYADPNTVTFMWLHEVARNPRVRVIRVLWSD
ncbi:MAG: hypothetical protein ACJ8R9_29695 [Steroidobacteraceae bacterium]